MAYSIRPHGRTDPDSQSEDDDLIYSTFQLSGSGTAPLLVTVNANNVELHADGGRYRRLGVCYQ